MLYTIEHAAFYKEQQKETGLVFAPGKVSGFPGMVVFKTQKKAQEFLKSYGVAKFGFKVYGVVAEWKDTRDVGNGLHRLNIKAEMVELTP